MNKCLFLYLSFSLFAEDLHEEVFSHIYRNKIWGVNGEGEGGSGGGSLLENVQPYMRYLEKFMRENEIRSVVDAGCGDWEFSKYIDWEGIDYLGLDVVLFVIEKNQKRYGKSHIRFAHANFLTADLPKADLFICKHVFQHLTNRDILAFLPKLSKFKYCLITNEVDPRTFSSDNPDIDVGGGHKIDLSRSPFFIQGTKILNFYIGSSLHQVFLIKN
ncbi:MAG: hypothetical protein A3E80_01300 [Chlamydiae bacterium RIFCSPHIGHO2_12_FULL_49_9]|nr:MAG: hypothetical protein A3E80_01300 [Chlamydiae bacterium RIFCSPHIGHO2_12_FULL_49_9]